MAKFVKDDVVKGESPQYLQYARKSPAPEKVENPLWKGLTGMLETVGTVIDNVEKSYKQNLDQTIQSRADAVMMEEKNRLEGLLGIGDNTQDQRTVPTSSGPAQVDGMVNAQVWGPTGGNTDVNPQIIPDNVNAQVDRAVERVGKFTSAAQQGKEPSHYAARAFAEWRNIRKDVPVKYRGYADQKMSSVLGFDPANKYIGELNTQLKAVQKERSDEKNKILQQIDDLKTQAPEAVLLYSDYLQGKIDTPEAMRRLDNMVQPIVRSNVAERQWKTIQNNDAVAKWTANDNFDKFIAAKHTTFANTAVDQIGINMSPNDIRQKVINIQAGKDKTTQEQLTVLGRSMSAHALNLRGQLEAEANRPNPRGLTMRAVLGDEAVNKKINDAVKQYDDLSKFLLGGNYDMAQFVAKNMKDKGDDFGAKLLEHPELGKITQIAMGIGAATQGNQALSSLFGTALLGAPGVASTIQNFTTQHMVAGAAQHIYGSTSGKAITVTDSINHMLSVGAPVPTGAAMAIENINKLNDPNLSQELKQGLVTYYFHPSNMGLLQKFDAKQRGHVFNLLTSPGTIDAAWEATKNRPDLRAQMVDWARHSFGVEFMTTEIKDLNSVTMPEGFNISFDPKKSHLRLMYKGQDVTDLGAAIPGTEQRIRGAGQPYTPGVQAIRGPLNRINQAIDNVKYIAKKTDTDPNMWLVDALRTSGLNVDQNRIQVSPDLLKSKAKEAK